VTESHSPAEGYRVVIKNSAKSDLKKLRQSHLRARFEKIVGTLRTDPYMPTDSFEKLQPPSARFFSRRLSGQHRVVYTIDEQAKTVTIYSAWSHYQ